MSSNVGKPSPSMGGISVGWPCALCESWLSPKQEQTRKDALFSLLLSVALMSQEPWVLP